MIPSAACSTRKTLDPSARDFVPGSQDVSDRYQLQQSGIHYPCDTASSSYGLFSGASHFSPSFNGEYFVQHQHVGFPAPAGAPPTLPPSIYEWQPSVQPRFYPDWHGASSDALHSQTYQGLPTQHETQAGYQPQQVFPHQHHLAAFHSQSAAQQQAFPYNQSQQPFMPLIGGQENRHQLPQEHYVGDHVQVYRLPAPPMAAGAPPLLQAPVMMQNYGYQAAWEPNPVAPALGQPAFPTVTKATAVTMPRGSGTAQPFVGRDRMSRALQLIGVPTEMNEAQLAEELGQWGEIRALEMSRHSEGLITVHYFDLRSAKSALADIQNQHLLQQQRVQQQLTQERRSLQQLNESPGSKASPRDPTLSSPPPAVVQQDPQSPPPDDIPSLHASSTAESPASNVEPMPDASQVSPICQLSLPDSSTAQSGRHVPCLNSPTSSKGLVGGKAVWAHYTIPVGLGSEDCLAQGTLSPLNQGTLVVFNVDASMQADVIRAIFERHGSVKEVREAPQRRQHRFVEFYDVRRAATALQALDGTELEGKKLKIEFSRPGGNTARRVMTPSGSSTQLATLPTVRVSQTGHNLGALAPPVAAAAPPAVSVYWQHPLPMTVADQPAPEWSHTITHSGALLPAPVLPPQPFDHGFASHLVPSSVHHGIGNTPRSSSIVQRDHVPTPLYRVLPPRQAAPISRPRGTASEFANPGEGIRARGLADHTAAKRAEVPSSSSSASWRSHIRRGAGGAAASLQSNECFRFDENEAESSGRTTLMIRNIPNKYTQQDV